MSSSCKRKTNLPSKHARLCDQLLRRSIKDRNQPSGNDTLELDTASLTSSIRRITRLLMAADNHDTQQSRNTTIAGPSNCYTSVYYRAIAVSLGCMGKVEGARKSSAQFEETSGPAKYGIRGMM